ncbi:serine integrase family protein [Oceanibaculum indicum]|uniref:Resolvase-like protein n=1 Tax=Oceanibaculum indicum TaxID=526216 RepID=A0A420WHW8_9PROT|nr:recombinase family protein [Oceanibaculum indicum]RKQ70562.1 resolvase-like protein [Oceanibaculum indicum]
MTFWACTALTQAGRDVLARYPAPLRIARFERLVHKCDEAHFSHPRQNEVPVIYYDRSSDLMPLSSGSGTYERMDESFRWMSKNGYRPVIVICENATGMESHRTDRRRGLRRLLQVYRAMGYRIVVPRYDRLTRNPEMMAWLLEVKDLRVISIAERSILGSAQIIAAIRARKDGRLRRESGKKGYEALVARGKGDAGLPNLEKHRKKGHKTLADRQRQDALDCARDMERAIRALLGKNPELKTASYGRIAGWLNEHGYTTATNGRYGAEQVRRYMKHVPRLEALRARKLVEKPIKVSRKRKADSSDAAPAKPSLAVSKSVFRESISETESARKLTRRGKRPKLISLDAGLECWRVPQSHYLGGEGSADDARVSAVEVSPSFESGYDPAGTERLSPCPTSADISGAKDRPDKPTPASAPSPSSSKVLDVIRRARESEWELSEYPSNTWSPEPDSYRRKRRPHTSTKPPEKPAGGR